MSHVPFYQTRDGRRFYESTVPDLVRQLEQLNTNIARIADLLERRAVTDGQGHGPAR